MAFLQSKLCFKNTITPIWIKTPDYDPYDQELEEEELEDVDDDDDEEEKTTSVVLNNDKPKLLF